MTEAASENTTGQTGNESGNSEKASQDSATEFTNKAEQKSGESELGDAGKKALDAMKAERDKARREARENSEAAKRLKEIEDANASDLEKAVKAAREEGRAEVQSTANARLINAEARALAAEAKFRNPGLAIKAVDLSAVSVSDDGTVDVDSIRTALADLALADPYLVDDGKTPRPKPDGTQGNPPVAVVSTAAPGMDRMREAYANPKKNP